MNLWQEHNIYLFQSNQAHALCNSNIQQKTFQGASINYEGKILPISDPPPPCVGKFTTYAYVISKAFG